MTIEQLGLTIIIALGVVLSILAQVFGEDLSEWAEGAWKQWKEQYKQHRRSKRG